MVGGNQTQTRTPPPGSLLGNLEHQRKSFWAPKRGQQRTHLRLSPLEMRLAHLQPGRHQGRARPPTSRHAPSPTASLGGRTHRRAPFAESEKAEQSDGEAAELHASKPKVGDIRRDSLGTRYTPGCTFQGNPSDVNVFEALSTEASGKNWPKPPACSTYRVTRPLGWRSRNIRDKNMLCAASLRCDFILSGFLLS